jgi:hypothetical protein
MAIKEKEIKSVTDFIKEINAFKKDRKKVWYRGHSESNYKLEPSIYRKPFSASSEEELTNQFKSRAIPYLEKSPSTENYWEWLFIMQHYKIPTRLLDWTESALVALAFAVIYRDNKKRTGKNVGAHVWCLDPLKLNSKFNLLDKETVPNITENKNARDLCAKDTTPHTGKLDTPVAVYGPQNNPRIVGQKGVFTVFPSSNNFQFDESIGDMGLKLVIKTEENVKSIASELYDLGISESMIFPELDSISSEIKREHIAKLTSPKSSKKK